MEGFDPQQIVKNAKGRADVESALLSPLAPLYQTGNEDTDQCENKFKVYTDMSATLQKLSRAVRKDDDARRGLDKLEEQLKASEFLGGQKAKKLEGTKTIYYLHSGGEARLFFIYSKEEKGAVIIIGESNKDVEARVIKNMKRNYR